MRHYGDVVHELQNGHTDKSRWHNRVFLQKFARECRIREEMEEAVSLLVIRSSAKLAWWMVPVAQTKLMVVGIRCDQTVIIHNHVMLIFRRPIQCLQKRWS